jgi:hypothetical protein
MLRRHWLHSTSLGTLLSFLTLVLSSGAVRAQTPVPAAPVPVAPVPAAPSTVAPDMAAAQAHFQAGKDAFAANDFTTAIKEWKAAQAIKPSPKLHYNIGMAYERLGRPRAAVKYYKLYLEQLPTAANRAEVEQRVAMLEPRGAGDADGSESTVPGATGTTTPPYDASGATTTAGQGQPVPPVYYYGQPPAAPVQPPPPVRKSSYWWIVFPIIGGVLLTVFFIYILSLGTTTTYETDSSYLKIAPNGNDGVPPPEPALFRF